MDNRVVYFLIEIVSLIVLNSESYLNCVLFLFQACLVFYVHNYFDAVNMVKDNHIA